MLQYFLLLLAQNSGGIDTHDLSKKIGGFAVLALIVLVVVLVAKQKKQE